MGPYYTNQKMSINGGPPEPVGGYSTDNYTEYALEFLRGRAAGTGQALASLALLRRRAWPLDGG